MVWTLHDWNQVAEGNIKLLKILRFLGKIYKNYDFIKYFRVPVEMLLNYQS